MWNKKCRKVRAFLFLLIIILKNYKNLYLNLIEQNIFVQRIDNLFNN